MGSSGYLHANDLLKRPILYNIYDLNNSKFYDLAWITAQLYSLFRDIETSIINQLDVSLNLEITFFFTVKENIKT